MKKIFSLFAMLSMAAVILSVCSCSKGGDPEPPYVKFDSPAEVTVNNAENQATLKIQSNTKWNITGVASWCTPDVTSGSGNRTVNFTIQGNPGAGLRSVVMKIEAGSDRLPFTVTQSGNADVYTEGESRAVEINRQNNPINVVIVGDGFTKDDLVKGGAYDKAMDRAREAFFDIEPYRTYRENFNIYYVYAESAERGATYGYGFDGSTRQTFAQQIRNTAFGAKFTTDPSSTSTSCNYQKVFNYARMVPALKVGPDIVLDASGNPVSGAILDVNNVINKSVIIVVINDTRYAGTCLMYGSGACIGMCPMSTSAGNMSFEATLRHEVGGHGFGKFTDEYIYYNEEIPETGGGGYSKAQIRTWQSIGNYLNMSLSKVAAEAPALWQPFLGNPDYAEVGFFEGGCTYAKGIWRAESNSIMNNNVRYYNGPQAYAIYSRIKQITGGSASWADFAANDAARKAEAVNAAGAMSYGAGEKFIPLAPPIMIPVP